MSLNASEVPKSVPNGLRYRVACARTNTEVCFAEVDWLASREQAVAFALKLRATAGGDFRGISLTLDYPSPEGELTGKPPFCETTSRDQTLQLLSQAILTGERMPSEQILASLHMEAEILTRLGFEFTAIECHSGDATFMAVNHRYVTLYYFTAS